MCEKCQCEREAKKRLERENERLARKYKTMKSIAGRTPWPWLLGVLAATVCFCFSFYYEVKQNTFQTQNLSREMINTKAEVAGFQSDKVLINHKLQTLQDDVKDIKSDVKTLLKQTK